MPKFIVQYQGQESVAELKPGANSVGRQSTCSIPLKDSTLSRLHCEVILAGPVATIVDKGSRNGTLLNGKKIDAQVLQPGDKIQIGATTLWYEMKNVASEKKDTGRTPAPKPAAAPAPSTRRAAAEPPRPGTARVAPPAPAAAPTPAAREAVTAASEALKDYAYHGKAGGSPLKIVAIVLVVAGLGVGLYLGRGLLTLPAATIDESDNLVARNAHFDAATGGKPEGWALRPSLNGDRSSCNASVDGSRGRNGSSCLVIDKGGGAADLVGECAWQEDLPLPKGAGVDASAWTQFESFNGWAAVKIDWLRNAKGPTIAEEYSDAVKGASSWTEVRGSFNPPPGAGAFRIALVVVGRTGRAFFDDVAVKIRPNAPPPAEKKIGNHRITYVRSGGLQVELRGARRSITNLALRLESQKEGPLPQAFSTDVGVTNDDAGLLFQGRLVNPLDFREVPFEERAVLDEGSTKIVYQFRGDALKQVDRVTIAFTLPRVDGPPRGVSETEAVSRISCSTEDGDFAIEYSEPARVKVRNVDGRFRVFQTWAVDPAAEDPFWGLRIREASGPGPLPQEALAELRGQRKLGQALALAREQAEKIKEAAAKEKMKAEVAALEESERRDWAETQALAFQGRLSRRSDLVAKAMAALQTYSKEWSGEGDAKAEVLRKDMEKELASSSEAEADRPRRVFERAKKYVEGGKRAIAQSLLQTVVARYPTSDVAPAAQALLKTLSE